ncbi:hypothetical protein [Candidatus Electronema sp. PJ]|uniref:hypothetical protein n=1 Tax=Candidatus Electronema sp. PJ TaxID=3401572 RepID=UPI003AA7D687
MSKSPFEQVALTIRAADSLTEVYLVDSQFQRIAAGVGSLEAQVAPGLYKARFKVGRIQADSLIEVKADTESQVFDGPPVQFDTPVPMPQTITWRQEHEKAARKLSRTVHLKQGNGSQLFLFCRGLSTEAASPWLGLSLHDLSGKLLAEPSQGRCDKRSSFFALNIELDPGTYRLRVEEEPGEIYEIFIVTLAGWQTQVFTLAEQSWLPGVDTFRAALPIAAVLMAELGKGFDPASVAVRQTELLRLALLNGRNILTETGLKHLLADQPLNPMTAIFATHLLLRQENAVLVGELAGKMESTLAAQPDVQVALLNIGNLAELPAFPQPPMLYSSWQLIMDAVSKEKAVIPPDSVNAQIKDGVLNTVLWLLHRL